MGKNKYIEVIDHYYRLFTERRITREIARWSMQAVTLCALIDDRTTHDDYDYILEYRDKLLK